ncbi:aminopeptidase N [Mangrovihabitans endophyticus]|nr:aminopeptidase N [Mangrovihabitans endophyticus]
MPSLNRTEAAERAAVVTPTAYDVDLDLTGGGETFRSRTVLRFTARSDEATFAELAPARLHSATLNGVALPPSALSGERLALTGLRAENELVVDAAMSYSNDGEGLHRFVDPADGATYLYAMSFLDAASRIFACFDQPDLKAPVTVSVTAPPGWLVAGNAPARAADKDGRWEFAPTRPLATYLVSLIAGPYHARYDEHDGLPLALYARRSLAAFLDAEADELFTITKQCLDRYAELFTERYPFGHYQQAFVPEFNAGAMENPGLVTVRDEMVYRSAVTDKERELRATVIAHEMAHMWFGDLVTMAWWDDLWLNESYADYMGVRVTAEATRFTGAWTTFAMSRKSWGMRADQRPSTHAVAPAEVHDTELALLNFDGISYAKGAAVLRQLAAWLGDDVFLAGVDAHLTAHRFGNATLADLLGALGTAGDRDLSGWADVWLRRAQVNTLRAEITRDEAGRYAEVAVVQTAPEDHPVLRPHRLALGLYDAEPDGTVRCRRRVAVELDPDRDGGRTPVAALVGQPAADLLLLNDGDLTYAKVRLDDATLSAAAHLLPAVADPLARALVWASVLDATVDGERPVADLVALVLAVLPTETDTAVVETVVRRTIDLVARYATAQARPAAMAMVAQACDRMLTAAPAGSSRQLAAAYGSIGATVEVARLRGWLDGAGVPEGLAIDNDLRWRIVSRLTVLGGFGPADIAAELDRDRSATGEQWAARCRAALPDPDAKARAWDLFVRDAGISVRLAEASASGFWQPEQRDLTAAYVERYFADMPEVTRVRKGIGAETIATAAYPRFHVEERTRRLAAELAARPGLTAVLRRVVADSDDDMRRALAARSVG